MRTIKIPFCVGLMICLLAGLPLIASAGTTQETPLITTQEAFDSYRSYYRNYDSSSVDVRRYNEDKIARIKEDPELSYGYTRAPMTLWDAFWLWVAHQLQGLFKDRGVSPEWDRLILFVLFTSALVYVIIRLLKINSLKIFYGEKEQKPLEHAVAEENIHEMDFETLVKEATTAGNYRLAVRLLYLWALKLLTDANHVTWVPGKTNYDYLREIKSSDLKNGFRQLSYYFEYAWYGNFSVTPELFKKVSGLFNDWKTTV